MHRHALSLSQSCRSKSSLQCGPNMLQGQNILRHDDERVIPFARGCLWHLPEGAGGHSKCPHTCSRSHIEPNRGFFGPRSHEHPVQLIQFFRGLAGKHEITTHRRLTAPAVVPAASAFIQRSACPNAQPAPTDPGARM